MVKTELKVRSWERLPTENEHEWELFNAFKDIFRSIPDLIRTVYAGKDFDATKVYVYSVAKENQWKKRCSDFDSWIARQRDNATAEMLREETKKIASKRMALINDLARKVNRVSRKMDKIENQDKEDLKQLHIGNLSTFTYIVKALLDEYRKIEQDNATGATEENPFTNDTIMNANERLTKWINTQAEAKAKNDNRAIIQ